MGHSDIQTLKPGWQASLQLGFERVGARSILSHRRHTGPLQVQRVFYPEADGCCHAYLLHPPGGVVGGDELAISVQLAQQARVLITTPAAGKFYRSAGATAHQHQRLSVAADASLEWFPQENIFYNGAQVSTHTQVQLDSTSHFSGWEILCFGRPASNERYESGHITQTFEIWRAGAPLWVERSRCDGGSVFQNAAWGMAGQPVMGSFVCVTRATQLAQQVRAATLPMAGDDLFAVTQLEEVLVCRYLGSSVARARQYFLRAWEVLRPLVRNQPAQAPRIWYS